MLLSVSLGSIAKKQVACAYHKDQKKDVSIMNEKKHGFTKTCVKNFIKRNPGFSRWEV